MAKLRLTHAQLIDIKVHNSDEGFKFDLTYREHWPDGHIYDHVLKDVDNPFLTDELTFDKVAGAEKPTYLLTYLGSTNYKSYLVIGSIDALDMTEPVEVTMDDIEKMYGRPVKIVK